MRLIIKKETISVSRNRLFVKAKSLDILRKQFFFAGNPIALLAVLALLHSAVQELYETVDVSFLHGSKGTFQFLINCLICSEAFLLYISAGQGDHAALVDPVDVHKVNELIHDLRIILEECSERINLTGETFYKLVPSRIVAYNIRILF